MNCIDICFSTVIEELDFIVGNTYYIYYIVFNNNDGFLRKLLPVEVKFVKKDVYYSWFEDSKGTNYRVTYGSRLAYGNIFKSIEDCIDSFNNTINNRIDLIKNESDKKINKLKSKLIKL